MKRLSWFLQSSLVAALIAWFVASSASAQTAVVRWYPQARIPQYGQFTEEPPFLLADQNHTIHAFNAQPIDLTESRGERAIFYRQWSLAGGWTTPIDIVVDPKHGPLDLVDVYGDASGTVYLLFQMDNTDLYLTQAPLAQAHHARAWSPPLLIGGQAIGKTAGIYTPGALSGDGQGKLVVIYSGLRDGNGIYAVISADNGMTWSEPEPIDLTYDVDLLPVSTQLNMGATGHMHAVWSTFYEDGSGGPGYYAQLDLVRGEWSEPWALDAPGIRTPNVIEYGNEILVTYYHHSGNQNWWRSSQDGGNTWSRPALISPTHIGTNRAVSFAVDSADQLHLLFGQRIDDNHHGLWHTTWTGAGWTPAQAVVSGPQIRDRIGGNGFDPTAANAVVSNGNLLFVTWGTDGAAGENGAWYSYAQLDTAELPAVPLPEPSLASPVTLPTLTPQPANQPTRLPTAMPESSRALFVAGVTAEARVGTANPGVLMLVGLTPTVVLLVLVVFIRQRR
jgi:hypothetical protein